MRGGGGATDVAMIGKESVIYTRGLVCMLNPEHEKCHESC